MIDADLRFTFTPRLQSNVRKWNGYFPTKWGNSFIDFCNIRHTITLRCRPTGVGWWLITTETIRLRHINNYILEILSKIHNCVWLTFPTDRMAPNVTDRNARITMAMAQGDAEVTEYMYDLIISANIRITWGNAWGFDESIENIGVDFWSDITIEALCRNMVPY